MLAEILIDSTPPSDRPAVVTPRQVMSWGELRRLACQIVGEHGKARRRRIGLCFQSVEKGCAALAAMEKLQGDLFLMDGRLPLETLVHLSSKFKLGVLLVEKGGDSGVFDELEFDHETDWSGRATVTILTSGTTGEPKAATHTWETLGRPVRRRVEAPAPRWLLCYRPHLYAGLQVILQCLVNGGTLVAPNADAGPGSVAGLVVSAGVQFISATPSYWRRLLMLTSPDDLKGAQIAQVTLGGEVVDQVLLDNLNRYFPKARLVHIYATTELGRCFSVTDGKAGFPASYLRSPSPDGVELRVEAEELYVKSANAMRGYDAYSSQQHNGEGWFATGDLVVIQGERVFFAGRKTDMINVSGNKVHPIEVEGVIRRVPGVADVRVFGKRSSIAGQLVACEIVPEKCQEEAALRQKVQAKCLAELAAYQRPRFVNMVSEISLSAAAKTVRRVA